MRLFQFVDRFQRYLKGRELEEPIRLVTFVETAVGLLNFKVNNTLYFEIEILKMPLSEKNGQRYVFCLLIKYAVPFFFFPFDYFSFPLPPNPPLCWLDGIPEPRQGNIAESQQEVKLIWNPTKAFKKFHLLRA